MKRHFFNQVRNSLKPTSFGLFFALLLGSCAAPENFDDAVPWYVASEGVHDAASRLVDETPFLRFNDYDLYRFERLLERENVDANWREAFADILVSANAIGNHLAAFEIDRLPDPIVNKLAKHGPSTQGDNARKSIRKQWLSRSSDWLKKCQEENEKKDDTTLWEYADNLHSKIQDSIKEESSFLRVLTHLPLVPVSLIAVSSIENGEYWGPAPVREDFKEVAVLTPSPISSDPSADWQRLLKHAPVIVQQIAPDATYDKSIDRVGHVILERNKSGEVIATVDTSEPAVYAHTEWAVIQGETLPQLVYTLIYPEHPALKSPDFEAGKIEVIILRMTLDKSGRPAIFESVYACGCHHRIRVAQHVAQWAGPNKQEHHPMEVWRDGELKGAHVVEDIPDSDPNAPVCLYQYAGYHMSGLIQMTKSPVADYVKVNSRNQYRLIPYEELEHQKSGNAYLSLFDDDGLIVGAERAESFWLAGAGFFAAGHPRERGTQRILLDSEDFGDPTLLDHLLHIPHKMVAEK